MGTSEYWSLKQAAFRKERLCADHLENHLGAVLRVELSHLQDLRALREGNWQCRQGSVAETITSLRHPWEVHHRRPRTTTAAESFAMESSLKWDAAPEYTRVLATHRLDNKKDDKETSRWHKVDPHESAWRFRLCWWCHFALTQSPGHIIQTNSDGKISVKAGLRINNRRQLQMQTG